MAQYASRENNSRISNFRFVMDTARFYNRSKPKLQNIPESGNISENEDLSDEESYLVRKEGYILGNILAEDSDFDEDIVKNQTENDLAIEESKPEEIVVKMKIIFH